MMELPELSETVNKAEGEIKNLVPWLPDPYKCDKCNVYCDATHTYSPQEAAFYRGGMVPSWECPSCGEEYRRVEPWHE